MLRHSCSFELLNEEKATLCYRADAIANPPLHHASTELRILEEECAR
jgi:hypothetical protein